MISAGRRSPGPAGPGPWHRPTSPLSCPVSPRGRIPSTRRRPSSRRIPSPTSFLSPSLLHLDGSKLTHYRKRTEAGSPSPAGSVSSFFGWSYLSVGIDRARHTVGNPAISHRLATGTAQDITGNGQKERDDQFGWEEKKSNNWGPPEVLNQWHLDWKANALPIGQEQLKNNAGYFY